MYWKIDALTAKRSEISQTIEGSLEDVKNQADIYSLEVLTISPDYEAFIKSMFRQCKLSSSVLSVFFKDFADMQRCGLSVHEALAILNESSSSVVLKEALRKISNYIHDGRSLEESFENTKVFPKIVCVTLSAAEKTGNIPELLDLLAQYYTYKKENRKKVIRSLIYPGIVVTLLTGLSIFITIKLVPLLNALSPNGSSNNLSADFLIGYAGFIKEYWLLVPVALGGGVLFIKFFRDNYKQEFMEIIFTLPLFGNLIKNMELSHVFLNIYVYQRSGVNIIETITNIHQANKTYVTDKLILIRDRVFRGSSLAEAFRQDSFFPSFVYQNLSKGQVSGYLPQYFERVYKYFDIKYKDSLGSMIAMVEPLLVILAASFLLLIVCAFILPLYTNMAHMGPGVFK